MFKKADTDWESYTNLFFRRDLIDGGKSNPPQILMRRRENGVWLYRRPDAAEEFDAISRSAW